MECRADRLKHFRCHRRNGGVLRYQAFVDLQFGINTGKPTVPIWFCDYSVEVST